MRERKDWGADSGEAEKSGKNEGNETSGVGESVARFGSAGTEPAKKDKGDILASWRRYKKKGEAMRGEEERRLPVGSPGNANPLGNTLPIQDNICGQCAQRKTSLTG